MKCELCSGTARYAIYSPSGEWLINVCKHDIVGAYGLCFKNKLPLIEGYEDMLLTDGRLVGDIDVSFPVDLKDIELHDGDIIISPC